MLIIGHMLFSGFEVLAHTIFSQWAIYVLDCTSLPNALPLLTIYAQNIIIPQVIKFSIFLFKSTGQTINTIRRKKMKSDVIFLIIKNLFEMLR